MHTDTPREMDFLDWLDTLDDEQHHAVYEAMRAWVEELGVQVAEQPHCPQYLFKLFARVHSHVSLN